MNHALSNFQGKKYEVNLVIDTAAYGTGEVLSDRVEIVLSPALPGGLPVRGEIIGLTLLDKDDEGAQLDLVVLDANVSLGTINSAPNISDTDAQAVVAVIPVTSYSDLGGCKVARPSFDPVPFETATGKIYIGAINGAGTPTYASASDLRIKASIRLHNVNL
jgi:hypothetical protein